MFIGILFGPLAGAQAEKNNARPTTKNNDTFFITLPLKSWDSH
jgi:hypothetical protein